MNAVVSWIAPCLQRKEALEPTEDVPYMDSLMYLYTVLAYIAHSKGVLEYSQFH